MGIEQFFSSIKENNITNLEGTFATILENRLDADMIYIDFNSIVYITSFKLVAKINKLLYNLIQGNDTDGIEDFKEKYTDAFVTDLVLSEVRKYIENIVTNYVNPAVLQYIIIDVDGVPSKSKILEQKKRRYMGTVINEIKKQIFEKHKKALDKKRYTFELTKIEWSRNNISPGTVFMDKLNNMLAAPAFHDNIKKLCPKLKKYMYSGVYDSGEGEKKIMDHISTLDVDTLTNSRIVIYSPDSDVTLLGLLTPIKHLKLLRHNQQKGNYSVVDIEQLRSNMYKHVTNKLKNTKVVLDKEKVIHDIVLVLTIFGNDFLPKLESFTVRQDFDRIIDLYVATLRGSESYLVVPAGDRKVINQKMLLDIIDALHRDEGGNLQKKYMDQHYQNYNKLKKIFGADQSNFTTRLNEFLGLLRQFNADIKTGTDMKGWINNNKSFLALLQKLTRIGIANNNEQFVIMYQNWYKKYNQFPKVAVTLRRYSKSLEDEHHMQNLTKSLHYLDASLPVTAYDKEIYKFENMLDEYTQKLNAHSLNLGYVSVHPKSYIWKTEKIDRGVRRYYAEFFDINDINVTGKDMRELLDSYIEGLVWVFDYYYNKPTKNKADTWFYKYTHAPLLTQLYMHLKTQGDNYIMSMLDNIKQYKVPEEEFFKTLEHFMYVMPIIPKFIPKEYREVKEDLNIDKIVDDILEGNNNKIIDCRGAIFLTKCNLNIKESSWKEDKEFINKLRQVKLPPAIEKLNQ
jgi:5'-3' exonuclease